MPKIFPTQFADSGSNLHRTICCRDARNSNFTFKKSRQFVCPFQQILSCKYLAAALESIILQSKSIQSPVNLFHKSSNAKRKGNSQLSGKESGHVSLPVTCECVCTCGDPVPPKPVRRVMFSDDTCSCDSQADKLRSLPSPPLAEAPPGCCGCDSSSRFESREDERRSNDAAFRSVSPVPNNHYKSPHEVDGEYSYAYR